MEAGKFEIYMVVQQAADSGGLVSQVQTYSEGGLLENFSTTESFCSIRAFSWWDTAYPHDTAPCWGFGGICFTQSPKHPAGTLGIMFDQVSEHPVPQADAWNEPTRPLLLIFIYGAIGISNFPFFFFYMNNQLAWYCLFKQSLLSYHSSLLCDKLVLHTGVGLFLGCLLRSAGLFTYNCACAAQIAIVANSSRLFYLFLHTWPGIGPFHFPDVF